MKTVLFVPGYMEGIDDRDYAKVLYNIREKGYKAKFVPIEWRRTTIEDWVKDVDSVYRKYSPDEAILAGFSFGAMTAFVSASSMNPSELWLFSLSPYFLEDFISPNMTNNMKKVIGKNRTIAFQKLAFNNLSKKIKCKTLVFAGDLEIKKYPELGNRARQAEMTISKIKLVLINNVGHDVSNDEYVKSIINNI